MDRGRWMGRNRGPFRGRNMRGMGVFRGGRGSDRGWGGNRGAMNRFDGGFRRPNNYSGNFNQWKPRGKRDMPGKRLTEEHIGVTEYMSEHEGFNGIIKSRYSDFQVSEINEKGEIAKLTDLNPPAPPAEETVDEDEELLTKYNLEILPIDTWDKINALVVEAEPKEDKVEIDVTGVTKEQRTKIHEAVKRAFSDSVVGSTVSVDDKKFVRFVKYKKGVRIDKRVKWMWPADYVHFVVHKENCDTMDAAVRIAERIGIHMKPSMLGYAGTKDRRAKTAQWFSARRVDPRKLAAGARQMRDIRIGNYSFGEAGLKLGMLKGNLFRICLRNVTAPDSQVDRACQLLRERGFLNYYGLQRFGARADTPTYLVGLKLLQGKFKEAIDAILEVRDGPLEYALSVYKEKGPAAAYKVVPKRAGNSSHSETKLLKALADCPTDLVGALNKLARNTRLLYIHSYQSWLWNRAVSERVRRFGLRPAVGDLVPLTQLTDEVEEGESDNDENETDTETTDDGGDTENGSNAENDGKLDGGEQDSDKKDGGEKDRNQKDGGEQDGGDQDGAETKPDATEQIDTTKKKKSEPEQQKRIPVKVLTQEDIDSGQYTIFDIILPLAGYQIQYPPNMQEYFEEMLKTDGLTTDLRRKIKSYNLGGAYRHMAMRPVDVSWRTARYADPFADLIASDVDELEGKPITGMVEDGQYKAVLLTLSLPSSCYATMALRELLRADTSSNHQASQNDYHKASKRSTEKEPEDDAKKAKQEDKASKRSTDNEPEDDAKKAKPEDKASKKSTEKEPEDDATRSKQEDKASNRSTETEPEDDTKKPKQGDKASKRSTDNEPEDDAKKAKPEE